MFKHDPKLGASPLLSNCHAPACTQAAEPYPEEAATCPVLNSSPRKKETSLIPSSLQGTSDLTLLEKALTISPLKQGPGERATLHYPHIIHATVWMIIPDLVQEPE